MPVELPTSESGSEDDDDNNSDDSAGSSDFIVEDGPGNKAAQLPEEFTVQKQSWQYKFKIIFQYLVLLAVKGEDAAARAERCSLVLAPGARSPLSPHGYPQFRRGTGVAGKVSQVTRKVPRF